MCLFFIPGRAIFMLSDRWTSWVRVLALGYNLFAGLFLTCSCRIAFASFYFFCHPGRTKRKNSLRDEDLGFGRRRSLREFYSE
jgi:hypothetical protein